MSSVDSLPWASTMLPRCFRRSWQTSKKGRPGKGKRRIRAATEVTVCTGHLVERVVLRALDPGVVEVLEEVDERLGAFWFSVLPWS